MAGAGHYGALRRCSTQPQVDGALREPGPGRGAAPPFGDAEVARATPTALFRIQRVCQVALAQPTTGWAPGAAAEAIGAAAD